MRERRYTYTTEISLGGDAPTWEGEVTYSFTVAWGSPESGHFGPPERYDPGSGDVVEDVRVERVNGDPRPWGWSKLEEDSIEQTLLAHADGLAGEMLAEAREDEAAEADHAAEYRAEQRREALEERI